MAPLALVANLATRWHNLDWFKMSSGGAICIVCKVGHQVASLALPHCLGLSYWHYQLVLTSYPLYFLFYLLRKFVWHHTSLNFVHTLKHILKVMSRIRTAAIFTQLVLFGTKRTVCTVKLRITAPALESFFFLFSLNSQLALCSWARDKGRALVRMLFIFCIKVFFLFSIHGPLGWR